MADVTTIAARLRAAGCVFAEDEAALLIAEARSEPELEQMVGRRVAGEPFDHVLGWSEFCGLRIAVAPAVFVPRPRTELLAATAERLASAAPPPPVVVDLCCGSGAIAAVVEANVPGAEVHAVDTDPRAVDCARGNLRGPVHLGSLYEPLPAALRGRVAVIVANAPYVPTSEIALLPLDARLHEPLDALDGGTDGLAVLRRVVAGSGVWLAPGGSLVVEASDVQAGVVAATMADAGLAAWIEHSDELEATVVGGTFPGRTTGDPLPFP